VVCRPVDATVWDVGDFTKDRDRLLEGDIARQFLLAGLADPQIKPLLSAEPFSVKPAPAQAGGR
jgi:hypothetical protein